MSAPQLEKDDSEAQLQLEEVEFVPVTAAAAELRCERSSGSSVSSGW